MAPKRKAAQGNEGAKVQRSGGGDNDLKQLYQSTLTLVLNLQDETGVLVVDPFLKLPPKKLYPDYYQIIATPISLQEIQKKAKTGGYESIEKFKQDFQLMVDNATKYNDPASWIVLQAQKIFDFVSDQVSHYDSSTGATAPKSFKADIPSASASEPVPKLKIKLKVQPELKISELKDDDITFAKLPDLCTRILKSVINHEFPGFGKLSTPFMDEVDTKQYPEYLNFVKTPTSFNTILSQIRTKKLFNPKLSIINNLKKFHEAYDMIFSNAQLFNDPSSIIHQDAVKLRKYTDSLYNELYERAEGKSNKLKMKLKQAKVRALETFPLKEEDHLSEIPNEPIMMHPILDQKTIDSIKLEDKPIIIDTNTFNTMGKSLPLISLNSCVIQNISISSTQNQVQNITQQVSQRPFITNTSLDAKKSFFPTHSLLNTVSLFEYQFRANGFATQAYSLPLPPDSPPFINLKVSLHHLLYQLKKPDLVEGPAIINMNSEEEFQCKIQINEEESQVNGEVFEDEQNNLLGVSYELKLHYGLNILEFECKTSPALSKRIKPGQVITEDAEAAGRHTRHQLQQMKLSWDVEKFTFYIVLNNA